jgi:hypothetical protein
LVTVPKHNAITTGYVMFYKVVVKFVFVKKDGQEQTVASILMNVLQVSMSRFLRRTTIRRVCRYQRGNQ